MLNIEQTKAVERIDGPVMVIAGPGTGKTQILANRIAKILEITDSHAQNILCLTYTDAGTVAMKKRLLQYIGNDAHRVSVHTFHSFCSRVIQENPEAFQFRNLQPVSQLERIELLNNLALFLDEDHILKKMKGNVGYLVGQLGRLFSWMKKEDYTSNQIEILCEKFKESARENEDYIYKRKYKDFKAGDLKIDKLEKLDASVDELIAAAHLFQDYSTKMDELNRYDFDDMILWVLKLFSTSESVLNNYRELFHYILVDEFQDTSGAQNKLVEHLTSYWDNPNIFVVGDDDQSIYRFQGAEVQNVADFAERFGEHLFPVILTQNYRSTQAILDAAKCHIDQNNERLVNLLPNIDKKLLSVDVENIGNQTQIWSFQSAFNESVWICNTIQKNISAGVNPEEIAIIYRNHRHAEELAKIMSLKEIPVYFHRGENALHSAPVKRLLAILQYVNAEVAFPYSGESYLFELMHQPVFNLKPLTCARVSHFLFSNRLKWRDYFSNVLDIKHQTLALASDEKENLSHFGAFLENLIKERFNKPLLTFIDFVVKSTNLTQTYLHNAFDIECIRTFLDYVQTECQAQPQLSLDKLLEKLDLMESYHISLPKQRILYNSTGVQFMTAHASKGLEFEHVYILNCSDKVWDSDRSGQRPYGFINIFETENKELTLEENRRLFYVAMTRAKKTLTLSHHIFDNNGKDVVRSSFIDNLLAGKVATEHEGLNDATESLDLLNKITTTASLQNDDILDKHIIDRYLENYQLSASHLNAYLNCPTAFYFEQILRVPSAKNKYMSFGTAVHRALDEMFRIKDSEPDLFNSAHLRKQYETYLFKERFVFSDKEFEDFLSLGKNTLTEYFNARFEYWASRTDLQSEVTIDRIEIDGVPVKGQLDLMDIDGQSVQVVDFKTGDASKALPRLKPPKPEATLDDSIEAQHGGPYWRQMMFYALLIRHNTLKPLAMTSGVFEFVEPDKNGSFQRHKIIVETDGLEHMKTLIKTVYQNISDRSFSKGCQSENCNWCAFVSKNENIFEDEQLPL